MPYSGDIWLPAVTITTNVNDKFRLLEDPGVTNNEVIVTIAEGTYYLHSDSTLHSTHLGLYRALTVALAASAAVNGYAFGTADPTTSSSFTNAGLKLTAASATYSFQIDFDNSNFTMDPGWFGFRLDPYGGLGATNAITSTTSGADEVITSEFTIKDRWYSHNLAANYGAVDKRSRPYKNTRFSSTRPADGVAVEWDSGRVRRMRYEWTEAAHVWNTRGDDADTSFYTHAGLGAEDIYNAWEDVWDTLSDLKSCIIVHNDQTDLQVVTHSYELVKLRNQAQAEDINNVVQLQRQRGEYYAIDCELWIDPDVDNYAH